MSGGGEPCDPKASWVVLLCWGWCCPVLARAPRLPFSKGLEVRSVPRLGPSQERELEKRPERRTQLSLICFSALWPLGFPFFILLRLLLFCCGGFFFNYMFLNFEYLILF